MGKLLGNTTNSGVTLPGGQTQFGDPSELASRASQTLPSAAAMTGPDILNPSKTSLAPLPSQISQPSFFQASHMGPGGTPNALSPALTTKGKILTALLSAVRGGLAGEAGNAQTYAATGRNAGFGGGAAAGMQLPYTMAAQEQGAERGALENQTLAANMPFLRAQNIAKLGQTQSEITKNQFVTPRGGGVYDITKGQYAPGAGATDRTETPDQQVMDQLTTTVDPTLGRPLNAAEALAKISQMKQDTKPQNDFDQFYRQWLKDNEETDTAANRLSAHKTWEIRPEQPGAGDARGERSYQATMTRVEKLRQPVEQRLERISRLEDTLNQNNPQADSLIAPELLTVMAGGQGSGLRMNEAEIARIVGGANNWQRMKASVMAWQADPSKPFAFQPAQRQQIRDLFTTIKDRVSRKAQAIDEESQNLADSNDPQDHRTIYNRLQKRLLDVDTGSQPANARQGNAADPLGIR